MSNRVSAGWAAAWITALATFLIYALTMPRGLTWDLGGADGGELAGAVYSGGLVHSPGYPTYLLAAQLARVIPAANFAHALNLFSALCAALAAGLVAASCQFLVINDQPSAPSEGQSRLAAFCASLIAGGMAGFAPLMWSQAVIAEVYTLAGLFCAGLLLLTLWTGRAADPSSFTRRLVGLGIVGGVGLGSHYMIGLLLIFAAIYLGLVRRESMLHPRVLLAGLGLLVGLGVFAYLPLRAGEVPLSNWGNPDTLERFWWVVSNAAYRDRFSVIPPLSRVGALIGVIFQQVQIPGLTLIAVGGSLWWERQRALLGAALVVIVLNGWLVAAYDSVDILAYLIPTLCLLALMAGSAVYAILSEWLPESLIPVRGVIGTLMIGVVISPVAWMGYPLISSVATEADDYGQRVVEDAPPGSVIISDTDGQTFALRYAVLVTTQRTDLTPMDVRLLQFDWFRADIGAKLGLHDDFASQSVSLPAFLAMLPADTPVVFTYLPELPPSYTVIPMGNNLTYLLISRPQPDSE